MNDRFITTAEKIYKEHSRIYLDKRAYEVVAKYNVKPNCMLCAMNNRSTDKCLLKEQLKIDCSYKFSMNFYFKRLNLIKEWEIFIKQGGK